MNVLLLLLWCRQILNRWLSHLNNEWNELYNLININKATNYTVYVNYKSNLMLSFRIVGPKRRCVLMTSYHVLPHSHSLPLSLFLSRPVSLISVCATHAPAFFSFKACSVKYLWRRMRTCIACIMRTECVFQDDFMAGMSCRINWNASCSIQ